MLLNKFAYVDHGKSSVMACSQHKLARLKASQLLTVSLAVTGIAVALSM